MEILQFSIMHGYSVANINTQLAIVYQFKATQ